MAKKQDGRIDEKQIEWLKKRHRPEDVKSLLQEITKAVLERDFRRQLKTFFPNAQVQLGIVHPIRNSSNYGHRKTCAYSYGLPI